jgi:hypothetical protein
VNKERLQPYADSRCRALARLPRQLDADHLQAARQEHIKSRISATECKESPTIFNLCLYLSILGADVKMPGSVHSQQEEQEDHGQGSTENGENNTQPQRKKVAVLEIKVNLLIFK